MKQTPGEHKRKCFEKCETASFWPVIGFKDNKNEISITFSPQKQEMYYEI